MLIFAVERENKRLRRGKEGERGIRKGQLKWKRQDREKKKCGGDDQDRNTWERCEVKFRRRVVVDIESRLSRGQGQACQNCRNSGRLQLDS